MGWAHLNICVGKHALCGVMGILCSYVCMCVWMCVYMWEWERPCITTFVWVHLYLFPPLDNICWYIYVPILYQFSKRNSKISNRLKTIKKNTGLWSAPAWLQFEIEPSSIKILFKYLDQSHNTTVNNNHWHF